MAWTDCNFGMVREPLLRHRVFRAGESPGARLSDFAARLGKVSLSRVCHPRTSPVSGQWFGTGFFAGRRFRIQTRWRGSRTALRCGRRL